MNHDFSELQKMLRKTSKLIQNAMGENFDQINQAMKGLTDAYFPSIQKGTLESIRFTQERLLEISKPAIELDKQMREMLKPIDLSASLIPRVSIPSDLFSLPSLKSLEITSLKLNEIAQMNFPSMEIPGSLVPKLEELVSSINFAIPEIHEPEVLDETMEEIEQDKPVPQKQEKSLVWTWDMLRWILDRILKTIITIYLAQLSAEQLERHHIEKMEELKKQTIISEQHLEINNEMVEQMEDALNIFLESIDDYLPKQSDDHEPETLDSKDQE